MAFKKNQRVFSAATGIAFRVESGPWLSSTDEPAYLIERLEDHTYRMTAARHLLPATPRQGDMGSIRKFGTTDAERHYYSPHTFVYGDEYVILLRDRLGDYETFTGKDREHVLNTWEPQS